MTEASHEVLPWVSEDGDRIYQQVYGPGSTAEKYRNKWRGYRLVTQALVDCENKVTEFIVGGNEVKTGLNCRIFDQRCVEYDNLVTLLKQPGFQLLSLDLFTGALEDEDWVSYKSGFLRDALAQAKAIQHVRLRATTEIEDAFPQRLDPEDLEEYLFPLRTIFPIGDWCQLRYFGMSNMLVDIDDLIGLLADLPPSLRCVELSHLAYGSVDQGCDDLLRAMRDTLDWQIKDILQETGTASHLDKATAARYFVYAGNSWISYDDPITIKTKIDYANKIGISGVMIWAIDLDDSTLESLQAESDPSLLDSLDSEFDLVDLKKLFPHEYLPEVSQSTACLRKRDGEPEPFVFLKCPEDVSDKPRDSVRTARVTCVSGDLEGCYQIMDRGVEGTIVEMPDNVCGCIYFLMLTMPWEGIKKGRWISISRYWGNSPVICNFWGVAAMNPADTVIVTDPTTGVTSKVRADYQTEHVFEGQVIGDFFSEWLDKGHIRNQEPMPKNPKPKVPCAWTREWIRTEHPQGDWKILGRGASKQISASFAQLLLSELGSHRHLDRLTLFAARPNRKKGGLFTAIQPTDLAIYKTMNGFDQLHEAKELGMIFNYLNHKDVWPKYCAVYEAIYDHMGKFDAWYAVHGAGVTIPSLQKEWKDYNRVVLDSIVKRSKVTMEYMFKNSK
ncbi:hypothetical protein FOYG_14938 [Fusarium oxysporum NRRL 32931]|uniref:GH18 domain-containing protein n=1 Tax=Fusarium oxysporum NRRL 32931 TaxID=660029 RepID=W9HPD9_FUSOX|nr:hypothetical protein FOYG_14938 [Fusarium oxysporum NRRL 32931]